VALPSKEAFLYVFDRITGQPVWPIEERPVPQSDVPGEKTSPTQPFPTKPPAYARQSVGLDDLIDFTPELNAEARRLVSRYKLGPMFLPGVVSKVEGPIAALTIATTAGGTNWPGAAADPENHIVYAQASNHSVAPIGLIEPPAGFSDIRYVAGTAGQPFVEREGPGFGSAADAVQRGRGGAPAAAEGGGRGARGAAPAAPAAAAPAAGAPPAAPQGGGGGLVVQGLPLLKPPYGLLNAIDLDKGELKWQVPHGDTPDAVRNSPVLAGKTIPKTGQPGSVGLVVTKSLVVLGDPSITTTPEHPRLRQDQRQGSRRGVDAGAAERLADDLHGQRAPVLHRRGQRRQLLRRVHCLRAAAVGSAANQPSGRSAVDHDRKKPGRPRGDLKDQPFLISAVFAFSAVPSYSLGLNPCRI
jgi:quinoprotein glucose dehydrogenase